MHHALHIQPSSNLNLTAYCDANSACSSDDRKSIAAYCVFWQFSLSHGHRGNNMWWHAQVQESEYRIITLAAAEIVWL